jgi:hypothetical protein
MSLGKMQISFLLFFAPKFHLISYLELYGEKVDKDEISYNKAIATLHFFSYDPCTYIPHTKNHIWG